ncbi:hypothetical protein LITTLEE_175 [Mycobacterium phage LittleE]|uniref:Helix-turn-helix DNA binding protein n=1 Tax=Mycobacterium phage LittleE TaxID=2922212 RepID=G1D460_9CAUD|nr:exonuclease [Mycobacterium phage LittleE]AEK09554.1 hypothetical protein LITTLEE_175 [Mycobacterium phage LittleE]
MSDDKPSLGERLAARAMESEETEYTAKTEFDGVSGYIQTGPVDTRVTPEEYSDILVRFGYDPKKIRIVGYPRVSRWQQRARKKVWSDEKAQYIQTHEFETVWLEAYRFSIAPTLPGLDLPALYAAVERDHEVRTSDRVDGQATVVVAWGDVQTGKVDHLGGMEELLHRLQDKRDALREYLARTPHDHIVVADVGDIIEGFDNVDSQIRTNGLSLMDQVEVAATEFWKTIKLCAEYAPVDVLSIPSNHCAWRRGSKQIAGLPNDDWGIHISKRLEGLSNELGLGVKFHRPESEYLEMLEFDIRGTRLGLAHGHQARNPKSVCDWWAKMSHAGELSCDVLLTGHFHFPTFRPSGRNPRTGRTKWHVQCSTLDNGSAWVRNAFGEDGDPALTVFTIDEGGFNVSGFALL